MMKKRVRTWITLKMLGTALPVRCTPLRKASCTTGRSDCAHLRRVASQSTSILGLPRSVLPSSGDEAFAAVVVVHHVHRVEDGLLLVEFVCPSAHLARHAAKDSLANRCATAQHHLEASAFEREPSCTRETHTHTHTSTSSRRLDTSASSLLRSPASLGHGYRLALKASQILRILLSTRLPW